MIIRIAIRMQFLGRLKVKLRGKLYRSVSDLNGYVGVTAHLQRNTTVEKSHFIREKPVIPASDPFRDTKHQIELPFSNSCMWPHHPTTSW